ncbi:LysR family transcriptional regulator [Jannaschia aquimarina]|uniref:HcaR_3 protein n=1 Tax=Jannaschia aquimarina TaxID=935700 RepID=A0A0D1CNC4_9RHOB|nr:LysR substrate-binding domain-containing protein [Jannaschia aquimarina]KIT16247.1 Hca operon transcriptional activator [Jannaschia aquimarina]SNT15342.1 DNA-binding transcriptional regulator, LysR family [Jannaschia aquimarina]
MDLRQIRCFIAVAEELHFRRAAERVGLAQTALSAQVRRLEEEMGVALLFRTTRHVSLTQAGAVFLTEARNLLDRLDAAIAETRAVAERGLDRLRIGGIDAALAWFLPPVFEAFRSRHPGIRLTLTEVSASAQQVEALERHHIDLAFFRPPTATPGIAWETLFEEGVAIALPAGDDAADAHSLSAEALTGRSLIGYPRHARPYLADMVARCIEGLDAPPNVEMEVLDKSTLMRLVAQGTGVGLVPDWCARVGAEGVRFVPLENGPRLAFGVAWRERDAGRETLDDFLALSRSEAAHVAG